MMIKIGIFAQESNLGFSQIIISDLQGRIRGLK